MVFFDNDLTNNYLYPLIIGIVLCIPSIVDYMSDYFANVKFISKGRIQRNSIIVAVFIPNLFILCYFNSLNGFRWLLILVHAQIIVNLIASCSYISSFKANILESISNKICVLLLIMAVIISLFSCLITTKLLQCLLGAITSALIVVAFLIYIFLPESRSKIYMKSIESKALNDIDNHCISAIMYNIFLILGGILVAVWLRVSGDVKIESILIYLVYLEDVSALTILMLENFIARQKAVMFENELEAKKAFLRMTSHEIRTPMNTISLALNLLRQQMQNTGLCTREMLEILNAVEESSDIATDLVSDLLTHDKIETGSLRLEKSPIFLWNLVEASVRPFFAQATQAGTKLQILDGDIPMINEYYVDGDKHKLGQVIRNLVSNALKFTPTGGQVTIRACGIYDLPVEPPVVSQHNPLRRLSFSSARSSVAPLPEIIPKKLKSFKIEVVDTGVGISKENQVKLFSEVIQFHAAVLQDGKGSGLGLYITKGIVDLHNGKISVFSNGEGVGVGTTFTLELPVYLRRDFLSSRNAPSLFSVQRTSGNIDNVVNLQPFDSRRDSRNSSTRHSNNNNLSRPLSQLSCSPRSRGGSLSSLRDKDKDKDRDREMRIQSFHSEEGGDAPAEEGTTTAATAAERTTRSFQGRSSKGEVVQIASESKGDSLEVDQVDQRREGETVEEYERSNSESSETLMSLFRVLIVDDTKMNRKLLIRLIQDRCVYAAEAEDGVEAVKEVRESMQKQQPYDIILMDYLMPNMDGPTAAKAIRDLGYRNLLIGVTGNTLPEQMAHFIHRGADYVLKKPLNLVELDDVISSM